MTYICAMCKIEFEGMATEEEAEAEKTALFGNVPLSQCDVVCDTCFQKIKPQNNPEQYEAWKKEAGYTS